MQNPLLSGLGVVRRTSPRRRSPSPWRRRSTSGVRTDQGNYPNRADYLFREIGAVVAPGAPPPQLPPYQGGQGG